MKCPGYEAYCLQPNLTLKICKDEVEMLCAKLDEEAYDVGYANEARRNWSESVLSRNWLGARFALNRLDLRCMYAPFFKHRFQSRAAIAALACRSYRDRHGDWPEKLDDLVPEFLDKVPLDPFDGKPLRYDSKDRFIWTPGPDLDFDGKVPHNSDGKLDLGSLGGKRVNILLLPPPPRKGQ